ncbi:MAG: hypothetical protein AcusKO_30040 [Acuticoccus sp.]
MAKINAVPYLRHCYETLHSATGALFVFGRSAQDQDRHIYDAIFSSETIEHLYFGVFDPADVPWLEGQRPVPEAEREQPAVQPL